MNLKSFLKKINPFYPGTLRYDIKCLDGSDYCPEKIFNMDFENYLAKGSYSALSEDPDNYKSQGFRCIIESPQFLGSFNKFKLKRQKGMLFPSIRFFRTDFELIGYDINHVSNYEKCVVAII